MSQEYPTCPSTTWGSFNGLLHAVDLIVLDSKTKCYGSPRGCSILKLQGLAQYNHNKPGK